MISLRNRSQGAVAERRTGDAPKDTVGLPASPTGLPGGCPYCAGARITTGINDLASSGLPFVSEWDHQRNTKRADRISVWSTYRAEWECPNGHRWTDTVRNRTIGYDCPICVPRQKGVARVKPLRDAAAVRAFREAGRMPQQET